MVVGIIIAVIVVLIVLWAVSAYNGLVTLRNRVKNGWAQIDVQLKQRTDLIPNLVETVKGYAAHESQVFTQVTQARAGVVQAAQSGDVAQRIAAENQLSRALVNLQAVSVQKYNTQTEVVPTNIIAGLFHFEQAPYFQVDEADRQVPQVTF